MIELILTLVIITLWIIGGQIKGRYRDIPIPILLGLYFAIALKTWWLFFLLGASFQIIRLGYGAYDPENDDKPSFLASLTHDRQGWYIRATWGLIIATLGILPLLAWHFIGVSQYLIYILTNALVNYIVCRLKLWVYITDFFVSLAICLILFLPYKV